jgi:cytoskeleton protein RodZ
MLSNYAAFLGMDADALLLRFAEGLQTQLQIRRAASPQPNQEPIRERPKPPTLFQRLITPDTIIGGLIVFALAAFVLWGIIRVYEHDSNTIPTPSPPSIAEVLLATATPGNTPTPLPVTDSPVSQVPLFPTLVIPTGSVEGGASSTEVAGAAVQVYLTVQQRTFMRVLVDGEVQFEGRVLPGSAYPFSARTQIEVMAGNGAGLRVFFNGVDLGLMGQIGEIVHQVFTVQGFFTPTPTITLTPNNTPVVTTTPTEAPPNILGTPTP